MASYGIWHQKVMYYIDLYNASELMVVVNCDFKTSLALTDRGVFFVWFGPRKTIV